MFYFPTLRKAAAGFLPSEAQWEYAARGVMPQNFPWGDEAQQDLLNVSRQSLNCCFVCLFFCWVGCLVAGFFVVCVVL